MGSAVDQGGWDIPGGDAGQVAPPAEPSPDHDRSHLVRKRSRSDAPAGGGYYEACANGAGGGWKGPPENGHGGDSRLFRRDSHPSKKPRDEPNEWDDDPPPPPPPPPSSDPTRPTGRRSFDKYNDPRRSGPPQPDDRGYKPRDRYQGDYDHKPRPAHEDGGGWPIDSPDNGKGDRYADPPRDDRGTRRRQNERVEPSPREGRSLYRDDQRNQSGFESNGWDDNARDPAQDWERDPTPRRDRRPNGGMGEPARLDEKYRQDSTYGQQSDPQRDHGRFDGSSDEEDADYFSILFSSLSGRGRSRPLEPRLRSHCEAVFPVEHANIHFNLNFTGFPRDFPDPLRWRLLRLAPDVLERLSNRTYTILSKTVPLHLAKRSLNTFLENKEFDGDVNKRLENIVGTQRGGYRY